VIRAVPLLAAFITTSVSLGLAQVRIELPSAEDSAAAADAPLFASHETLELVLEEYLIYWAYNLFTDKSFRVRLARITYVDTGPE
jgi:hypothetical protein